MKSIALFILWMLLSVCAPGQDYLAAFATQKATRTNILMETLDQVTIYKISSSIYPFIAPAGELVHKVPIRFQELAVYLNRTYSVEALAEIEYMVCHGERCATRYHVSSPEQGYLRAQVYSSTPEQGDTRGLKVEDIAAFFTLTELLGLLDLERVDKAHVRWPLLEPCYIPTMENRADLSCILTQMQGLTPAQRQDFLNQLQR